MSIIIFTKNELRYSLLVDGTGRVRAGLFTPKWVNNRMLTEVGRAFIKRGFMVTKIIYK